MHEPERDQHAGTTAIDEAAGERRTGGGTERDRAGDEAGDAERARLLAQEQQHSERVDRERQPGQQRRADQRADVGRAQDLPVDLHRYEDASSGPLAQRALLIGC